MGEIRKFFQTVILLELGSQSSSAQNGIRMYGEPFSTDLETSGSKIADTAILSHLEFGVDESGLVLPPVAAFCESIANHEVLPPGSILITVAPGVSW
jgi:hypothetical protein